MMLTGGYRSLWWFFHNKHGAFAARVVHGQTIFVDPTDKNAKIDLTSLPANPAVAEHLMKK